MLIVTIGFVFALALTGLMGNRTGYSLGLAASMLGMVFAFCAGVLVFLITTTLVSIIIAICLSQGASRRVYFVWCLGATAAVHLAFIVHFIAIERPKWVELSDAYPYESVASRLTYEEQGKRRIDAQDVGPRKVETAMLAIFEERLEQSHVSVLWREASLRNLHANSVEQFVKSPGFGAARMLWRPDPQRVEIPEPETFPLPKGVLSPSGDSMDYPIMQAPGRVQTGFTSDLHEESLFSFFNPLAFGYVKDREHVVGFQPHAFSRRPEVPVIWRMDKLELVSLLKYKQPSVYLSEYLPRMKELREAKTRPLDEFEKNALNALRHGEDIQVESSHEQIRMLGAIRAAKQCLKCHDVERGELLGAFSYGLRRER